MVNIAKEDRSFFRVNDTTRIGIDVRLAPLVVFPKKVDLSQGSDKGDFNGPIWAAHG